MATILIIDDEEIIRVLLRASLEEAGYEVTEASNGRQGLELYRSRPTDLVITDIVMPEMNGLDMLLELTREFLHAKVSRSQAQEEKRMSWMSGNFSGHGRPSRSPLACRICWALCDTNWNISWILKRLASLSSARRARLARQARRARWARESRHA